MTNGLLEQAMKALSEGKTLLYPTDTIWGIGCDATCADAVERIYAIKERDHTKSMLVLVAEGMLEKEMPQEVRELVDRTIRDYEFELMYVEGRDREQRKAPYDKLLRAKPFDYQFKNFVKCTLPGIQRLHRKKRGYEN